MRELRPADTVEITHAPTGSMVTVSLEQIDATVARRAFDSDTQMADFFGVGRAQPRKWREGAVPAGNARALLTDVAYVWRRLTAGHGDRVVLDWLQFDGNARLGHSPLAAIKAGSTVEVFEAWAAYMSGGYA